MCVLWCACGGQRSTLRKESVLSLTRVLGSNLGHQACATSKVYSLSHLAGPYSFFSCFYFLHLFIYLFIHFASQSLPHLPVPSSHSPSIHPSSSSQGLLWKNTLFRESIQTKLQWFWSLKTWCLWASSLCCSLPCVSSMVGTSRKEVSFSWKPILSRILLSLNQCTRCTNMDRSIVSLKLRSLLEGQQVLSRTACKGSLKVALI